MMLSRSAKLKLLADPKTPKNIDDMFRYDVMREIRTEEIHVPYILYDSPYDKRNFVNFDYDVHSLFRKYKPSPRSTRKFHQKNTEVMNQ